MPELSEAERAQLWQESLAEAQALLAAGTKLTPGQQAAKELEDRGIARAPAQPIAQDDLRRAIRGAKDRADLEARLAVLLDKQDPAFAESLALAAFCGDVLGYVNAQENQA